MVLALAQDVVAEELAALAEVQQTRHSRRNIDPRRQPINPTRRDVCWGLDDQRDVVILGR